MNFPMPEDSGGGAGGRVALRTLYGAYHFASRVLPLDFIGAVVSLLVLGGGGGTHWM